MRSRQAAVVDLDAFRRRKEQERAEASAALVERPELSGARLLGEPGVGFVWVPAVTWVCWVPVWTPR